MTDNSTNPFGAPVQAPMKHLRVGFGQRFLAAIIDFLLGALFIGALVFLLMQMNVSATPDMIETMNDIDALFSLLGVASSAGDMFYSLLPAMTFGGMIGAVLYSLTEGFTGASPGKRVLRIRIANQDGSQGDTTLYIRRWGVKFSGSILRMIALVPALVALDTIGVIVAVVIFIGYFGALGVERLALHDRIAQTAVYNKDDIT